MKIIIDDDNNNNDNNKTRLTMTELLLFCTN